MHLTGLTERLSRLPAIADVLGHGRSTRISGLLRAARPAAAAAVARHASAPTLYVVAHPQDAAEIAGELSLWHGRRVALFPALEPLPYERVRLDRTVVSERESVTRHMASGEIDMVVAPVRALLQPVPRPERASETTTLTVGASVALEKLLARWVESGYADSPVVEEPGTFARRGGVVDVFPVGAERPVRIELFGHTIDSMRAFDPDTQRSIGGVQELVVPPMVALTDDVRRQALERLLELDISTLTAEAATEWMNDLARLEAGAPFDELSVFAPYLLADAGSLAEYVPDGTVVFIDDPDECWAVMAQLCEQARDMQRSRQEEGSLPAGLRPALVEDREVRESLDRMRVVEFLPGSTGDETVDWSSLFAPAPLYGGRLRAFVRDLLGADGQETILATLQHERVSELLAEEDIPNRTVGSLDSDRFAGVSVVHVHLSQGWHLAGERLTLLTDHEVFGHAARRPAARKQKTARETFFSDFSPGDHVVHLEHGIGRFEGVTRMALDGAEREYALVQYAGTDRLYVPSDQLERLTRYVGMGEAAPQLNKLGGGEWQRARQRAKKAAEDIARELIDVYSKRMARPGHAFAPDTPWQHELESSFPFPETPDQLRAVQDVKSDMEQPRPMDRLVCADVGYGKTEVAVRAAFKAVLDGKQVAVLVPTTILAQQHFDTFSERFGAFPIRVEVMSRFRTPVQQRDILRRLAAGDIDIVIGTHRLLQKDVVFSNLGLLVVDEEQRFGVKHKETLKRLRETIDVLTLTATPIPRTLHMGLVGIREISVIETAPEGRLPIKTYLQPYEERLVREAVVRELDRDGQVYIVHNKVSSIDAMAERVRRLVPGARVLVGHGQMDEAQLEKVMLNFARHDADVLVASTIIENGLDIPNVNTIIVNHAEILGLTQLYQLRGRVGRSANQAYAYLLYPRDARLSRDAVRRMEAVFEAQDLGSGFNIAMKDLEIRGAGNLLGAEQSGNAAAVGFDLFTRMIGDAVEQQRGIPVQEQPLVTVDLPLTMLLPAEYIGNEAERLSLYRRLAAVPSAEDLEGLREELEDRFGALPVEVDNILASVRIKLMAADAHVTLVSLTPEHLSMRTDPLGVYDRVSLYRQFGSDARISTNVLRIPRHRLGQDWLEAIRSILDDMVRLRASISEPQAARA